MNFLIVDLEATCWIEKTKKDNEIIEIGACIVDSGRNTLSEFQSFVKPVRSFPLSDFCKKLTNIAQMDVDNAETFPTVANKFIDWFKSYDVMAWGSWGKYDFNQMLFDCYYHQILFPYLGHVNLKHEIAAKLNIPDKGEGRMLEHLGLTFEGVPHRALTDAKNIVRIIQKTGYQILP